MITFEQYLMGRDKKYPADFTDEIRDNAQQTVIALNEVIRQYEDETGDTLDQVASGWRPLAVNDATSNAAKSSTHITAEGGDIKDKPARDFARWCLRNLDKLEAAGLWMEDPQWTPTWVHLQRKPPRSGRRVYVPSTAPALIAKLPEQLGVTA